MTDFPLAIRKITTLLKLPIKLPKTKKNPDNSKLSASLVAMSHSITRLTELGNRKNRKLKGKKKEQLAPLFF